MPYLLDTNHCSYLMNGLDKAPHRQKSEETRTIQQFQAITDTVYMSETSLGELVFGAELSPHATKIYTRINHFKTIIVPVVVDESCWEIYGKTKATLKRTGTIIADMDVLIACTALRYGAVLVSNDGGFRNLPAGFQVENWSNGTP